MTSGSNYMGSGFAQTLDQKPKGNNFHMGSGLGLQGTTSAQSLTLSNYAVPSMDGKLIPAIPIKLALKNKPPTLAVVYKMKDTKTGKDKKYIHEIRINFDKGEQEVDVNRMVDDICRKETVYLNPAFISRQQVIALIRKLYQDHIKSKEPKMANGSAEAAAKADSKDASDNNAENGKGRKANFFERKRFLNPQNNEDSDGDNKPDNRIEDLKKIDSEPSKKSPEKQVASLKEEPAKPPVITEMFEVEEEEIVSMPAAKKSKPEAVRSAAPPKKVPPPIEHNDVELKLDDNNQFSNQKEEAPMPKKEKSDTYSEEDWNDNDLDLDDKGDMNKQTKINNPQNEIHAANNDFQNLNDQFFADVEEDPILDNNQNFNQPKQDNEDFFMDEFNDLDLEKEFNDQQMFGDNGPKKNNPFGQSITKELLQQSKKEIEKDGFSDMLNSKNNLLDENDSNSNDPNKVKKNGLQIEINETDNIAEQDDQAQQMLLENMMKNENKMAGDDMDPNMVGMPDEQQLQMDDEEDEEHYTEEGIVQQFDDIYNSDPALQQLLGDQPSSYSVEEKLSIIQAYKKGGGVQGLAEIIDDEEEDEQQNPMGDLPPEFDPNNGQMPEGMQYQVQDDGEEEEMDIDLENPEDVKIIENEFQKLYENEEKFKNDFGDEMFELSPLQKYQIIDAYNKNGMDAVMSLLNQSVDHSQNASAMMQQLDMQGHMEADESVIEHEGKRYTRIQIEGLREDDDEYLMDEEQNIYSLDFKFITNMGEHQIENDDGDAM